MTFGLPCDVDGYDLRWRAKDDRQVTAKQFNLALERLSLSQVGAGKMLGITDRTVRNYAAGDSEIPEPTAKLIRLALAGKVSTDDIENA